MSALEQELKTYSAKLSMLLGEAGKFVVIKGSEVVGVYDSYEDALKIGFDKFKLDPFLVKRITPAEKIQFFTRDLAGACQA